MKFLILLLLLSGCGDDSPSELDHLKAENSALTSRNYDLNQMVMSLEFQVTGLSMKICEENKLRAGCDSFKSFLSNQNVRLTSSQWSFCEQYYKGKRK